MRLQQYIITEGSRGKPLPFEEAVDLLTKNCKKAIKAYKNGSKIYRGVAQKSRYLFYDPKNSPDQRKSKNTKNYYTLIMDNSPVWNNFPKRSQSFICSTSFGYAGNYGWSTYTVFPYDGAKIGMANTRDIWNSFFNGTGGSLYEWIDSLEFIFEFLQIPLSDSSYSSMLSSFKKFDEVVKKDSSMLMAAIPMMQYHEADWLLRYEKYNNLMEFIEKDVLNPKKNDIQLTNINRLDSDREVWTDSKCIFAEFRSWGKEDPTSKIIEYIDNL